MRRNGLSFGNKKAGFKIKSQTKNSKFQGKVNTQSVGIWNFLFDFFYLNLSFQLEFKNIGILINFIF